MLLRSRRKTQYRQSEFLTPAPCMELEPPRHSPFGTAHGGKECIGAAPSINSGFVHATYIACSGAINIVSAESSVVQSIRLQELTPVFMAF